MQSNDARNDGEQQCTERKQQTHDVLDVEAAPEHQRAEQRHGSDGHTLIQHVLDVDVDIRRGELVKHAVARDANQTEYETLRHAGPHHGFTALVQLPAMIQKPEREQQTVHKCGAVEQPGRIALHPLRHCGER